MLFRGGGQIDPPPSISWFSSTPAEIGLKPRYAFNFLIGNSDLNPKTVDRAKNLSRIS